MKNLYATMVAVLLCANGYATDYKKAERTGKFDAFSMIAMQQLEQNAGGAASAKGNSAAAGKSDSRYKATVQMTAGTDMAKFASKGFHISTLVNNFGIITTTIDSLQILAEDKDVERISFNEYSMNLDLNKANTVTGVDVVHNGNTASNQLAANSLSRAYTGKGVMIGIFDNGFDPNHAMFLDKNGKSRFKMIISKDGSAITDSAKIAAYTTDYMYSTHATNVSGIAAGYYKGDNFQIEGVAPEADLAMGPIMSTASDLTALKTLAEYCKAKGQRLVTNMSYGTIVGPHDGSDLYSQALNSLIKEYDIVACNSAGNSGNEILVQKHTFTSSTDEMKAIFDLYTSYDQIKSYITTDNASPINMDIIVLTIADGCSTILGRYPAIVNGEATSLHLNDDLFYDGTSINIAKETIHDGLAGYAISGYTNRKDSYYRVAYVITSEEGQKVTVYNDKGCPFNTSFSDYTKELTSNGTANSSSSASEMLVVGAYITTPSFTSSYNNQTYKLSNAKGTWGTQEGEVANYSSYGTRYDGTEWPCVVAPGAYTVSAFNRYDTYSTDKKKLTNTDTYNNATYQFCAMSGTSMASPYMAGIAALWLEANPNLTHEQIKAIAQQTADVDEYCREGNHFYDQGKQAGAGKVNALTGLQYILGEMDKAVVDTLVLDENEAMPTGCSGIKHVVLKRTFNTTNYNTVVLPFSMDADQITATFGNGTYVYTFDIASYETLSFHRTDHIEANTPFLMITKAADTTFDIDSVEVVEGEAVVPGVHYDFTGYYGEASYLESGLYFISGGMFYRSIGKSKIKAYRAYFRPTDSDAKAGVMYIDGEATSIKYVGDDTQGTGTDTLYNINGQEVGKSSQQNLPKGVYVTKGKKYIVR